MPLYPTSFFLPASTSIPFLLEDKYLRGGWRVAVDDAARDAIPMGARTNGMRVYVVGTGKTWTLANNNLTAWILVPESALRNTHTYTPPAAIAVNASVNFTLATGRTAFALKVDVNIPDMVIECHTTSARNDTNPYKFVSYAGHLVDDGSSLLEDATQQFNRRFAVISNLESVPSVNSYWKITNKGASAVTPTVNIVYLTVEN